MPGLSSSCSPACSAPGRRPPPREQWIAVVAPAFRDAVRPLADHRRAQGMCVLVVTTTDLAPADAIWRGKAGRLHDRVRQLVRDHPGPSRVVLVGAVSAGTPEATAQTVVPPFTGTAGRMRGQPTDNPLGCLDGTRLPTVSVGRLPARTVAEAEAMVAKTLAYERQPRSSDWSRRLTILAGIPAYNPVVDRMLESAAFARFDRLNPVWTGRAVYTNPNSRFALPDRLIRPLAIDYLRDGQAVVLYLGHSDASGLYAGPTAEVLSRARLADPPRRRTGQRVPHLRLQRLPAGRPRRRRLRRLGDAQSAWPGGGDRLARRLLRGDGAAGDRRVVPEGVRRPPRPHRRRPVAGSGWQEWLTDRSTLSATGCSTLSTVTRPRRKRCSGRNIWRCSYCSATRRSGCRRSATT
ncbi:MAG: C25 family cysteine peptidase [Gemmataceae bacterium]